eukprot:6208433-Pleurochrysis_carterae.AAC.4
MFTSSSACLRKAAIPSGRWKGSENRRRTFLEAVAGFGVFGMCAGSCVKSGVALAVVGTLGRPGSWSCPVSVAAAATGRLEELGASFQGNAFSSK